MAGVEVLADVVDGVALAGAFAALRAAASRFFLIISANPPPPGEAAAVAVNAVAAWQYAY